MVIKYLTLDEMNEMLKCLDDTCPCFYGSHVWIQDIESDCVVAGILDWTPNDGIVGVWASQYRKDNYYVEKDYGVKWIAYKDFPDHLLF